MTETTIETDDDSNEPNDVKPTREPGPKQPRRSRKAEAEVEADEYEPDANTIWLLEDVEGIEQFAGRWLGQKYRGKISAARIVKRLQTNRLSENKTIVVVFLDGQQPFTTPEGSRRPIPNFVLSKPIPCADLYQESEDGFGNVQVTNLINENTGKPVPGLCHMIDRACFMPDEFGNMRPTGRCIYRPDDHTLRFSRD